MAMRREWASDGRRLTELAAVMCMALGRLGLSSMMSSCVISRSGMIAHRAPSICMSCIRLVIHVHTIYVLYQHTHTHAHAHTHTDTRAHTHTTRTHNTTHTHMHTHTHTRTHAHTHTVQRDYLTSKAEIIW